MAPRPNPRKALREAAKLRGERSYDPVEPCKKGHRRRSTTSDVCLDCAVASSVAWGRRNVEQRREATRKAHRKNPETVKRARLNWKTNNPDKVVAEGRERARLFKLDNPSAIPKWADRSAIRAVYEEAARRTREEGILYTVDHVIPLKGVNVCGLHVENNLQVITKPENDLKWRY